MHSVGPVLSIALGLSATVAGVAGPTACESFRVEAGAVRLSCHGGAAVLIQAPTPAILRVRIAPDGLFTRSLTVLWEFVKDDWPAARISARDAGESLEIDTAELKVRVLKRPFRIAVSDRKGRTFFRQTAANRFDMQPGEHFYGLGFQRMAFDVRGRKLQWFRAFRSSEATVPFFLSSRGYGFYSNNTWRHVFDFTGTDAYTVAADGGQQDYYILHGPSYKRILDHYTALTGRPWLAPRWALGVGYQSRYFEDQKGVLRTAAGFRREDVPLDWIGLEPGWEDVPYRMQWNWSPERFPDPAAMIRQVAAMGVRMGLWESGDAPKSGYTNEDVRKLWYRPRIEAAIRKGIRFFKQDDPYPRMISSQEMLAPELNKSLGGDGVFSAAEMNNLTNSLYSETALREYTRATGERAMIMFNGYNSSIASHRWPFTWEADFPLGVGALSASLSGHSLVSTRDRNEAPDGIHLGYLAPFCYLESWAYYKEPWLYSEKLLDMNRYYAKLRYRLIPYLYSSARQSFESGLPLMRPMLLEFQDDRATANLSTQFLLGDWLLVASATARLTSGAELLTPEKAAVDPQARPQVYLPKGRWYDFWTGGAVESNGEWRKSEWPKYAGGPLWVRGGAIVPMGPVAPYSDQEPLEVLRLDVYPSGASRYVVYEDDGRTEDYRKGAFATTAVRCVERPGGLAVSIGPRQGKYPGMAERRGYLLSVHTKLPPASVAASGKPLPAVRSKDDLVHVASRHGWTYDADAGTLWVKPAAGWRFDYDARGPGKDPDRDTAFWAPDARSGAAAVELAIALGKPVEKSPDFGAPAGVSLTTSDRILIADGTSHTAVAATVVDASRRRVHSARTTIRFEAEGPAVLACGNPACAVEAADGVATVTVTATRQTGPVRIRATSSGLAAGDAALQVVRGALVLKASPPERVKLSSDGAWLPLRATIYAAVQFGGVTVKSANTKLRLHVTGGSGKTPADLEATAVEGIATFPNIFFEKPPNYVLHIGGEGVEPARIPIY
jgi:alpha-glucosidase (family GH31 glycosyl hydrolase)